MKLIYSFRNNSTLAKGWQQAEAQDGMYQHPFGLPGTESWWNAIDAGHLSVKTVEGVVKSYKPSGGEANQQCLHCQTIQLGLRMARIDLKPFIAKASKFEFDLLLCSRANIGQKNVS
ncbi:MAG TPA: hypothetical protein VHG89_03065 [Verrucomicrobiae bacterium]|nr:hypothetical protein [Verrucomicrobiae bacterium]